MNREPDLITFFADAMLGRLAKWMRALGFDTLYEHDIEDDELVARAREEGRLILTRDTALSRSVGRDECLFVRDDDPVEQLGQVITGLGLRVERDRLFSRCIRCNAPVASAGPEEVRADVPEYVLMTRRAFKRCTGCGRVYWTGTHVGRILDRLAPLVGKARTG